MFSRLATHAGGTRTYTQSYSRILSDGYNYIMMIVYMCVYVCICVYMCVNTDWLQMWAQISDGYWPICICIHMYICVYIYLRIYAFFRLATSLGPNFRRVLANIYKSDRYWPICIFIHICIYAYICIYEYIRFSDWLQIWAQISDGVCAIYISQMGIGRYVYVYIYIYICIYIYVYIYIYMHIYVYMYIYVYIHIYGNIRFSDWLQIWAANTHLTNPNNFKLYQLVNIGAMYPAREVCVCVCVFVCVRVCVCVCVYE